MWGGLTPAPHFGTITIVTKAQTRRDKPMTQLEAIDALLDYARENDTDGTTDDAQEIVAKYVDKRMTKAQERKEERKGKMARIVEYIRDKEDGALVTAKQTYMELGCFKSTQEVGRLLSDAAKEGLLTRHDNLKGGIHYGIVD